MEIACIDAHTREELTSRRGTAVHNFREGRTGQVACTAHLRFPHWRGTRTANLSLRRATACSSRPSKCRRLRRPCGSGSRLPPGPQAFDNANRVEGCRRLKIIPNAFGSTDEMARLWLDTSSSVCYRSIQLTSNYFRREPSCQKPSAPGTEMNDE